MDDSRIARLRELALAVADGRMDEFTMRIPAEPNRDADLVIDWAAKRIAKLEAALADALRHMRASSDMDCAAIERVEDALGDGAK